MIVTIVTTAYNEEDYLPNLFTDYLNQTYPREQIEIVLLNSMSTDKTRELMLAFQAQYQTEFYGIQVVNNVKKTQPSGFNLGVEHAHGDCILKVDAHASVPDDFVANNVAVIETGEIICGGKRPTVIENEDDWSETLHHVEESVFGSSIANYRRGDKARYVDSIFHGMYRKEVFEDCGLLDEQLTRTEDNEFHYRVRQAGYQIKYDPTIISYQYMRPTLPKMLRQKYANGYWIGLTVHVKPACLKLYHFAPFLFVLLLLFSILMVPVVPLLLGLFVIGYMALASVVSWLKVRHLDFKPLYLMMPLLLFLVHTVYGVGTMVGLVKGIFWKKEYEANIGK